MCVAYILLIYAVYDLARGVLNGVLRPCERLVAISGPYQHGDASILRSGSVL